MDVASVASELERIITEDGPWTAHGIALPGGLCTIPGTSNKWEVLRATLALRMAQLTLGKPLSSMRVLDLGCLEGGITLALAAAGCEAVGLDVRETSLRKARFAAEATGAERVRFVRGDMLRLAELDLGRFDLILCAGTLYHVDAPDLVGFLRDLNDACVGIVVFDTHIALSACERYDFPDRTTLYGCSLVEYAPEDTNSKESHLWCSAENVHSFWPTERSLVNALLDAGFAHVSRPLAPIPEWAWQDRAYWVAHSKAHAESLGLMPLNCRHPLPEPDPRPPLCPTIIEEIHQRHPNPATRVLVQP